MARIGRRRNKFCGNDGIRHLDELEKGVRVVRDAGEVAIKTSWAYLQDKWGDISRLPDTVGSRCVRLSRVGISIRVPEFGGPDKQVRCPSNASLRCSGCVVNAALAPGFPVDQLGGLLANACGSSPETSDTIRD